MAHRARVGSLAARRCAERLYAARTPTVTDRRDHGTRTSVPPGRRDALGRQRASSGVTGHRTASGGGGRCPAGAEEPHRERCPPRPGHRALSATRASMGQKACRRPTHARHTVPHGERGRGPTGFNRLTGICRSALHGGTLGHRRSAATEDKVVSSGGEADDGAQRKPRRSVRPAPRRFGGARRPGNRDRMEPAGSGTARLSGHSRDRSSGVRDPCRSPRSADCQGGRGELQESRRLGRDAHGAAPQRAARGDGAQGRCARTRRPGPRVGSCRGTRG